jgi:hypothetical protein
MLDTNASFIKNQERPSNSPSDTNIIDKSFREDEHLGTIRTWKDKMTFHTGIRLFFCIAKINIAIRLKINTDFLMHFSTKFVDMY